MQKILEVKNLKTSFFTHIGEVKAIRDVSFYVEKGESIGIVGESGSGKSVTSLSIMQLIMSPGKIIGGEILFEGQNLIGKSKKDIRSIRGKEISMIFQDPMTSLNPVIKIGEQIGEVIRKHQKTDKVSTENKILELLNLVGIPDPKKRINSYPHEFSGGMRQRVMIAMALACEPKLLIADEPTTALDVTMQAQIMDLLKELREKLNMSIILITHDLGVVADSCSIILVMYGGMIMEEGSAQDIFYRPKHPYTIGLLQSIPKINNRGTRLVPIPGTPPDLLSPPSGCPFYQRCRYAMNVCRIEEPPVFEEDKNHLAKCWLLHNDAPIVEDYVCYVGGGAR